MKKVMMVLMAVTMFAAAMPAYAMEHSTSGHDPESIQCQKECDLLLRDCTREAATLQQEIKRLQAAIKKDGADQTKLDRVKTLKVKLDEAQALMKDLQKPGR